jgi:transcriptional regulator with XRE-family HTH domain
MLSAVKTEERKRARALRAQGWSVKEIERELGVSRGSVSLWVRDVPLGPEQRKRLVERIRRGPMVAAERKAAAARAVRQTYQVEGRRFARRRGEMYAAGCMLYWAEGAKARNYVKLANSDPELVVFFAAFLREHFGIAPEMMTIRCNLFADHIDQQRAIENYWLERLRVPQSRLRKSAVNVYSKYSQKKRKNRLPYGTCELSVYSTRIVQTIYGSIQELGGFDRPEWLD